MPSLSKCVVALAFAAANPLPAEAGSVMDLPDVESVLTKATGKMQDFAAQASAMQARVAQKQKASREALAQQKKQYEEKLEAQAAENSGVEATNEGMRKEIANLEHGNAELVTETEKLQKENLGMHDVLASVQEKVTAAKLFLSDSLRLTDDTSSDDLQVLEPLAPKPTLEHFLEVAKSSDALSFMQVLKHANPSEQPEDLVQVLSSSLADIATAEKEGEAELKAHFLAAFESGTAQHDKLMSTQQSLNATITTLTSRQTELKAAKDHLVNTRSQLQQRLHGLRVFARKVDAAAYTALKTVEPSSAAPASLKKTATAVDKKTPGAAVSDTATKKVSMLAQQPGIVQETQEAATAKHDEQAHPEELDAAKMEKVDPRKKRAADQVRAGGKNAEKAKKIEKGGAERAKEVNRAKAQSEAHKGHVANENKAKAKRNAPGAANLDATDATAADVAAAPGQLRKAGSSNANNAHVTAIVAKEELANKAPVAAAPNVKAEAPAASEKAAGSSKHSWFRFPWEH